MPRETEDLTLDFEPAVRSFLNMLAAGKADLGLEEVFVEIVLLVRLGCCLSR